jgi:hypothetical protein
MAGEEILAIAAALGATGTPPGSGQSVARPGRLYCFFR